MTDGNVGKRIGIYDVLSLCDKKTNNGHKLYHVKCIFCGWESNMTMYDIKYPAKCLHIHIVKWDNDRIHAIFIGMKRRCYNERNKEYRWYGDKGIKICDEWISNPKLFEKWAISNGYSDDLTIDRIDPSKDYCPENCRWVTRQINSKYKSTTLLIDVDGEVRTCRDWAIQLGIGSNRINGYVKKYGVENTIEFIRKYKNNPILKRDNSNQSYYDLYMN